MKFTKEETRRNVLNCAKQYQKKLLNKKFLIIYREKRDNSIRYIEVVFYERNYQHLTGLELIDCKGNVLRNHSVEVICIACFNGYYEDYKNYRRL